MHFDTGEEYVTKLVFGSGTLAQEATYPVGLYNSSDALGETAGTIDITTEPSGASYGRQDMTTGGMTISDSGGDWQGQLTGTLTYDTSDSTQSVDSYFVVVNYQSADVGGTKAEDHLFFAGTLDQAYDLNSVDSFELTNVGAKVT